MFEDKMTSLHSSKRIVFFDGYCNLCNGSVNLLMKLDRNRKFLYASLQGETAKQIPEIQAAGIESVIYFRSGEVHYRSEALLQIAKDLGGGFKLLLIFKLLPLKLRDGIYNWIANNRYKWFGKKDNCRLPNDDEKSLFLD